MSLEHPHRPLEEMPAQGEEPVHLWKPFHIRVDEHYNFIPRRKIARFYSYVLKMIAVGFFFCYNRIFYGFRVRGRKILRGSRAALLLYAIMCRGWTALLWFRQLHRKIFITRRLKPIWSLRDFGG